MVLSRELLGQQRHTKSRTVFRTASGVCHCEFASPGVDFWIWVLEWTLFVGRERGSTTSE